jgi:hypothetical protein
VARRNARSRSDAFHASAKGYWRDVLCCALHLQSHSGACDRLPVYADHQYLGRFGWVLEVGIVQTRHLSRSKIKGFVDFGEDGLRIGFSQDCR